MEVIVRRGIPEDLAAAYDLIKELAIYEHCEGELNITAEQFCTDAPGSFEFFIAETESRIVGVVLFFDHYSTWKGKSIYIEDLIVTAGYRNKGIGKLLLKAMAQYSLINNYQNIFWQVLHWNKEAISFYEKIGSEVDKSWYNCKWTNKKFTKFLLSES